MTHRDKERAKSLEYARSQGWINTGANSFGGTSTGEASAKCVQLEARVAELEAALSDARGEYSPIAGEREKAEGKIADLEVALAAERESHAVTKRAVTRGTRARCKALEEALRELVVAVEQDESPTLDYKIAERARGVLS